MVLRPPSFLKGGVPRSSFACKRFYRRDHSRLRSLGWYRILEPAGPTRRALNERHRLAVTTPLTGVRTVTCRCGSKVLYIAALMVETEFQFAHITLPSRIL